MILGSRCILTRYITVGATFYPCVELDSLFSWSQDPFYTGSEVPSIHPKKKAPTKPVAQVSDNFTNSLACVVRLIHSESRRVYLAPRIHLQELAI